MKHSLLAIAGLHLAVALFTPPAGQPPEAPLPVPAFAGGEVGGTPRPAPKPKMRQYVSLSSTDLIDSPGWHVHRCYNAKCNRENGIQQWSHQNNAKGDESLHACPKCGDLSWYPTHTGKSIQTTWEQIPVMDYPELLEVVNTIPENGKPLRISVGKPRKGTEFFIEAIPETESGVWKCFTKNGLPTMQKVQP